MAPISIHSEFRGMPGGIKVEKGHQSPLPRPLPHDASDPLSPPSPGAQEAEAEPEAGRQDAEVPGLHPYLCPSFSGHPEGRGHGKGKERKCAASWEVLGRQVLS